MSVDISAENERFIQDQIAAGVFRDRADVVDAGIQLLRRRDELQRRIDTGRRQLDEGDYRDYDDQTLATRFEQLKQRAQDAGETQQRS